MKLCLLIEVFLTPITNLWHAVHIHIICIALYKLPKASWTNNSICLAFCFVLFHLAWQLLHNLFGLVSTFLLLFQPEGQMHHTLSSDPNCISQRAVQPVGVA